MIQRGCEFSIEQFMKEGYSGPVRGLPPKIADEGYEQFFRTLGQSKYEPGPTDTNLSAWHHKSLWAYELATHPAIVEPMKQILGEDLVLWAMHFWYKEPGNGKYIPWHQDINYWPMEPEINATAWVSLGYSVTENGCLRVIPGTHRQKMEHKELHDGASAFGQGLDPKDIDETKAVDVEMTPGQITFFNEATFHGSNANTSDIPRVAFSVRYTTPEVKFKLDEWGGDINRIQTFLVAGQDRYHLNDAIKGEPPTK